MKSAEDSISRTYASQKSAKNNVNITFREFVPNWEGDFLSKLGQNWKINFRKCSSSFKRRQNDAKMVKFTLPEKIT